MIEIFLIVGGAIGVGFFLIFLLALSEKKQRKLTPRAEAGLTRSQFEKACGLVIEGMKLEIVEASQSGENRFDIIAKNPVPLIGGDLLIHCLYADPEEVVGTPPILELSNMVLQERLTKGIFITTGKFTNEIGTITELAPMEFVDGAAFQGLMKKYSVVFPAA